MRLVCSAIYAWLYISQKIGDNSDIMSLKVLFSGSAVGKIFVKTGFLTPTVLNWVMNMFRPVSYTHLEQIRVILQDGSIVHLNSDSRLRYPKQFGLFNRTVELWGEGYFNVAKDENRPFKVDLQGVEVRVTGTKFNVKAYSA